MLDYRHFLLFSIEDIIGALASLRQTRRGICHLKTDGPTAYVYMQDSARYSCSQLAKLHSRQLTIDVNDGVHPNCYRHDIHNGCFGHHGFSHEQY